MLISYDLNDRCEPPGGADWTPEDIGNLGIWLDSTTCGDGGLITAVPNEVLVTVDLDGDLDAALLEVDRRLEQLGLDGEADPEATPPFGVVSVGANAMIQDIFAVLPLLQGQGWSADLNYLSPVQPNNGFRPADNPKVFTPTGDEGLPEEVPVALEPPEEALVLVLDSTADTSLYDLDGNDRFDEDHSHGAFVHSIIDRLAPGDAGVRLQAVGGTQPLLDSGRWVPMMFSDAELLTALNAATENGEQYAFINLSLGGAGCVTSQLGWGVGERIALARGVRATAAESTIIAAAGNTGGDIKHFPAAWRDDEATTALAVAVASREDPSDGTEDAGDVAAEIEEIHIYFLTADKLFAVGSVDAAGNRDSFSNCGDWVNAVAHGADQIGYYPNSSSGYATWSGTSFATANVTAMLLNGVDPSVTGLAC